MKYQSYKKYLNENKTFGLNDLLRKTQKESRNSERFKNVAYAAMVSSAIIPFILSRNQKKCEYIRDKQKNISVQLKFCKDDICKQTINNKIKLLDKEYQNCTSGR